MTACPNSDQAENVGTVTRPVTQTAVVAVNRESMYGTAFPSAAAMGKCKSNDPKRISNKNPPAMIYVVIKLLFLALRCNLI